MFKFEITGIKEIDKNLTKLEKKDARKLIRQATRDSIKRIAAQCKANVPDDTGALKKAIKVRATKGRTSIGHRVFVDPTKLMLELHGGFFYPAVSSEFGSAKTKALHTFRKIFVQMHDAESKNMINFILNGLPL